MPGMPYEGDPSKYVARKNWSARPSPAAFAAAGLSTDVDPVCKRAVAVTSIASEYNDRTYCFCSEDCKAKFNAQPDKYARG